MQLVFMGTGEICLPVLDYLLENTRHDLAGVITQPDKPVGRKQRITPPEVKQRAEGRGIPVIQPKRVRRPEALERIADWEPDVIVVMAYGQILPKALLNMPKVACINLHASLLPRHRGAAPIQAAIRDGDSESGVTVMYVAEGLDTGDILLKHAFPLTAEETGQTLHDRVAICAPNALAEALDLLEEGKAPRLSQDEEFATTTGKLTREDGVIDWSRSAIEIERMIRAYEPWPGTSTSIGLSGEQHKMLKLYPPTQVINESDGNVRAGAVLRAAGDEWVVGTGMGALRLSCVQLEGKKRLPVKDFLAGCPLEEGVVLGHRDRKS